MTYVFSQLRQWIEHLENLENERSRREEEISLRNPQLMEVSQDKGEYPIIHAKMETILNNIKERLNANDNRITGEGVRMGEFPMHILGI